MIKRVWIGVMVFAVLFGVIYAATQEYGKAEFFGSFYVRPQANLAGGWKTGSYSLTTAGVAALGAVTATGINVSGTSTMDAVAQNGAKTWGASSSEIITWSSIALTSPTKTINVANKRWITLTSDASVTGLIPTGGANGQIVTIRSGTDGTNTMQFDDTTSCGLTGNIVLTESAAYTTDCLTLICVSADGAGNEWVEMSASVN